MQESKERETDIQTAVGGQLINENITTLGLMLSGALDR